jgi:hypothetical protein
MRRVAVVVILLCAIAGCARRKPAIPAPPTTRSAAPTESVRPDISPTPRREVAILFNQTPRYAEVVAQLRKLLAVETYHVTLADVEAENLRRVLQSLRSKPGLFVVAIGLRAARVARDELSAPIIFAQVFNYQELLVRGRAIRGVTAMPPLDLQIRDWKRIDPNLRRLGLIVSQQHTDLIPLAERGGAGPAGPPQQEQ